MSETMFQKKALEKLTSPEQLDELIMVTTPRGWLALLALCAIIITIVFWGIFGRIPTKVMGRGIIVRTGGVLEIPARSRGSVTIAENTNVGSTIKAGQVVATISQVELETQIDMDKVRLAALRDEHKKVVDYCEKQRKKKATSFNIQRKDLKAGIKEQQDQVRQIQKELKSLVDLHKKQLVKDTALIQARKDLADSHFTLRALQEKLVNLSGIESAAYHELEQRQFQSEWTIIDLSKQIKVQETRLKAMSQVISQYTGRILEVKVNNGTVVNIGTPIMSVEQTDKRMEVMIFVADTVGEKVHPGMMAELTPSIVKREEFGYIIGKVSFVSEFPVTERQMQKLLDNNPSLVKQLSADGVPFQVNANLMLDSNTPSGYKWSSGRGPKLEILSGTLCSASIIVREHPPIILVIPFLKQFFGLP